jgi:hypothetical protein
MAGHWTAIYRKPAEGDQKIENWASHRAKVEYTNLETKREFEVHAGVLSSRIDGTTLIPEFGEIVLEKVPTCDDRKGNA